MANQSRTNTSADPTRTYPAGYGTVEPVANYRPWDIDARFQAIYQKVKDNTMVDVFRLWVLWTLARRARPGAAIEIGSWRGGSGAVLATAVGARSPAAGTRVILADTFDGVVKAGERDTYYTGGEHNNTSPELVRGFLDGLGLTWVEVLVGTFPDDTAGSLDGVPFGFAHIDVDVYQSARDAFEWLWPRLVPGGVVVFDDYGFYGCEGVTAYVEELMANQPEVTIMPNLTGQAVAVKS